MPGHRGPPQPPEKTTNPFSQLASKVEEPVLGKDHHPPQLSCGLSGQLGKRAPMAGFPGGLTLRICPPSGYFCRMLCR